MTVSLTSIDRTKLPIDGGHMLTLTGVFESGTRHRVHIGTNGDSTDPVCHSGKTSQGDFIFPATATLMEVYTPLLELGGPLDVYIVQVDTALNDVLAAVLTTVKQDYKSLSFELRRVWPPVIKTGPRSMSNLDPV